MGMITSIRAPLPVAEILTPVVAPEPRSVIAEAVSAAPVAVAALVQAVQQVPPKPGSGDPQFLEARMTSETAAVAAAEAALRALKAEAP